MSDVKVVSFPCSSQGRAIGEFGRCGAIERVGLKTIAEVPCIGAFAQGKEFTHGACELQRRVAHSPEFRPIGRPTKGNREKERNAPSPDQRARASSAAGRPSFKRTERRAGFRVARTNRDLTHPVAIDEEILRVAQMYDRERALEVHIRETYYAYDLEKVVGALQRIRR